MSNPKPIYLKNKGRTIRVEVIGTKPLDIATKRRHAFGAIAVMAVVAAGALALAAWRLSEYLAYLEAAARV